MAVRQERRPLARREPVVSARPARGPTPAPAPTAQVPVEPPVERKVVLPFIIGPVQPVDERYLNVMVYGPYGHGKTTFGASALDVPAMRDVLFINAESGTMSLTSRRDLDTININKYDQLARIFEYLTVHCKYRDEGNVERLLEYERRYKSGIIPVKDQTTPVDPARTWFEEQRLRTGKPMDEPYIYHTVVLDSISELHKYLVYKFTGVDIGKTKLDEELEQMESWQVAQEMFRLLVRSFRDLPMHTIFVSGESIEPAERNRRRNPHAGQALPKLAGQMAADVAGFIDIVGYLVREIEAGGDTHRYLYLGAGYEGWISKHRFENLPDLEYVENPTLASLIDLARKDAEHGTSVTRPAAPSRTVTPSRNTARPAAAAQPSSAAARPQGSGSSAGTGRRGNAVRRTAGR